MGDPVLLAIVAAVFVLAGMVKGVIGLGLPTVSLGLLTAALDLTSAMALMIAPSLVTNLWQGAVGGHARAILNAHWPFLALATGTIWIGAMALGQVDPALLSALLGAVLAVYAAIGLSGARLAIAPRHRPWAGPVFGAANGVLTGMTGSFVVPGVMYLQAAGLPRDRLVQAMGMLFTLSTAGLAVALGRHGLWSAELGTLSALAVVPAILGMVVGARLRRRIPEAAFRRVFFAAILLLGGYIAARALGA